MKKILVMISVLLIMVTVLIGCGKPDPIQEDILNYTNVQLPILSELQIKFSKTFEGINMDDDYATNITKLKDVMIPAANEFVTKAKAVVPATEEVRKIHSQFIASATDQQEMATTLLQLLEAAKDNDEVLVKSLGEKIDKIKAKTNTFKEDLDALGKAHNIVDAK